MRWFNEGTSVERAGRNLKSEGAHACTGVVPPRAVRLVVLARLVVHIRRELVVAEHERKVGEPPRLALLGKMWVAFPPNLSQ